jgi:hypothetical protein
MPQYPIVSKSVDIQISEYPIRARGKGRTREGGRGHNVYRSFQEGHCHFGARCRYSHDLSNSNVQKLSSSVRERREEDLEQ